MSDYLRFMATEQSPAALRWNRAEYCKYRGPESMSSRRVTDRVTSRCGRVIILGWSAL